MKHFPHQKQAAGNLHQQQAAGEAQQKHSVEITIKLSLGLFITTKAGLLAGKYTCSYSPLVLWWPPLSHFKGKKEFFLASPWLQHLFQFSYNIPNIGKKALHQGSRQVLLSHKRHLQPALRSLASLRPLWLGRRLEWACHAMSAQPSPSNWQNAVQYAKPNAGYDHGTLSGVLL